MSAQSDFKAQANDAFAELMKYANHRDFDEAKIKDFIRLLNHLFAGRYKRDQHPCSGCLTGSISNQKWIEGRRICGTCTYREKRRRRHETL